MQSTGKLDWAPLFVALLLWHYVGSCLANPDTLVLPHLAGVGLGSPGAGVKITIGMQGIPTDSEILFLLLRAGSV
jgi:hypothetical protein